MIYFYYKNESINALPYFKGAINFNPNFIFPYTNSGWIYLLQNNYEQAFKNFRKHIELDPSSGFAYFKVGLVYYFQGKYKKSSDFFQKGISVDPKYHYNILFIYFSDAMQGNNSTEKLKVFVNKDSNNLYSLAIDMFAEKITEDDFLRSSSEITKNWSTANKKREKAEEYFYLGMKYLIAGNKKEAKVFFEKSVINGKQSMSLEKILSEKQLQQLSIK